MTLRYDSCTALRSALVLVSLTKLALQVAEATWDDHSALNAAFRGPEIEPTGLCG